MLPETFSISGARATWKSPIDEGAAPYAGPAFYVSQGGTRSGSDQLLLEALLAAAERSLALLQGAMPGPSA
jgi:hypothetical protein